MKNTLIFFVLLVAAGIAAVFIFGNPLSNTAGIISQSPNVKTTTVEDRGYYVVYFPNSFNNTSTKRMVLVLQPAGDYQADLTHWTGQADTHGFALAAIPDWSHDLIDQFIKSVKTAEGIHTLYVTGFSNGGYASCAKGLDNQQNISGIIPMGAYCDDSDLDSQQQTTSILTIIGAQDTLALGDDLILPSERTYSRVKNIQTEYQLIPGTGHQFPVSALDYAGEWIMKN